MDDRETEAVCHPGRDHPRNGQRQGQFSLDVDPADFALRFAGLFDGLGIQALLQPSLENRWRLRLVIFGP